MLTHASATHRFSAPPATIWARMTDDELMTRAFTGSGPIPGIDRIENLGDTLAVGLERIIHSSDGSTARERMTVVDAPNRQAYDLFDFSGAFRWLVQVGHSEWTLEPDGDGTVVTWTYTFEVGHALAWPVVRLLMPFFSRAQSSCLASLARAD